MKIIREEDFVQRFSEELIRANFRLRGDMTSYFQSLRGRETLGADAKTVVDIFLQNVSLAETENRAICQDTGYVQVYVEIGNEVQIPFVIGDSIQKSVADVYDRWKLRKSIADSLSRQNTGTNAPAFIHYEVVAGDTFHVQIMLKGGGSENLTKAGYLLPTADRDTMVKWVTSAVDAAGAKGCPPYILGIGIGGTLEKALHYSKLLLLRHFGDDSMTDEEKELAGRIQKSANALGIGFQGMGFGETVLSVQVQSIPCHIATLPIAVSIGCNAARQGEFSL
jgi:fumarate hydratase subunit alpha